MEKETVRCRKVEIYFINVELKGRKEEDAWRKQTIIGLNKAVKEIRKCIVEAAAVQNEVNI